MWGSGRPASVLGLRQLGFRVSSTVHTEWTQSLQIGISDVKTGTWESVTGDGGCAREEARVALRRGSELNPRDKMEAEDAPCG